MKKSFIFISYLAPYATVFFASGCIMVMELVATRLIARHLGSSLYTRTSVICVVLMGITIGNYLGGRIADRIKTKKVVVFLFATASLSCISTIIVNNILGNSIPLPIVKTEN